MRVRIQATYDGAVDDWVKIYADNKLLLEGRKLTPYEIFQALSERYPIIELEPMRVLGYKQEEIEHMV